MIGFDRMGQGLVISADEIFGGFDEGAVADEEWDALVERGGGDIQDILMPIGGVAASLGGDEGQRGTLVHQAQLAVRFGGVLRVGGVVIHATGEQVAVEIADQRADVARGERLAVALDALQPVGVVLDARAPVALVALVGAVILRTGQGCRYAGG